MNLHLGTAGYAYPAWVGGFYPRGTTQHDMLPYYATQFSAVEINSFFYRPPTREQIANLWRPRMTPMVQSRGTAHERVLFHQTEG
ncbi:MAG: DUF72 domain-containing protein [Planctomycetia bacterium]|nr:DUF72 domain-containing protein [Planctomycetia bacterium]